MKLQHSYSSLNLFNNCPKRYYHQRITKEVSDPGSIASKYGERVHKFLEDRLQHGTPLPAEIARAERMCQTILKTVEIYEGKLFIEHPMVLDRQLKPSEWDHDDAWVRSRLDMLLVLRDGQAIVMDWKTGKRKPDMKQMRLFAAQTFVHFPEVQKVKTQLIWTKNDPLEFDGAVFDRSQKNALLKELLMDIRRVEEAAEHDVWPAKPSGLCGWCPAQGICEFAKKSYRK